MEYQKIEENAVYMNACDNVKKIANAMKSIKIKYYPNFARITEQDRQRYNELENQMNNIVARNGLDILAKPLMAEISAKYDAKTPQIDKEQIENVEVRNRIFNEVLLACYGAIDAGKQALSVGRIKTALKCQQQLKKYLDIFEVHEDGKKMRELVITYKREKFGELAFSKEILEEKIAKWTNVFKSSLKAEDVQKRNEITGVIIQAQKEKTQKRETEEQLV